MTPEQFAYWLQGYAELNPETPPNAIQWKQIQDHLNLVFKKVTPDYTIRPGISPGPINPVNPMPYMPTWPAPNSPGITPWTTPGKMPEIICSVTDNIPNVSYCSAGDNIPLTNQSSKDFKYDTYITAEQATYKKMNERFKL